MRSARSNGSEYVSLFISNRGKILRPTDGEDKIPNLMNMMRQISPRASICAMGDEPRLQVTLRARKILHSKQVEARLGHSRSIILPLCVSNYLTFALQVLTSHPFTSPRFIINDFPLHPHSFFPDTYQTTKSQILNSLDDLVNFFPLQSQKILIISLVKYEHHTTSYRACSILAKHASEHSSLPAESHNTKSHQHQHQHQHLIIRHPTIVERHKAETATCTIRTTCASNTIRTTHSPRYAAEEVVTECSKWGRMGPCK